MMKRYASLLVTALMVLAVTAGAQAAGDQKAPKQLSWQFDGFTGTVDRASAQRGLQVYKEVCAACHGLKRIAFRNLVDLGFSEGEVKTMAAGYIMVDGPDEEGEMFERPGLAADYFPEPFPNVKAAQAVNNGAFPPDLTLMVKARKDGANYLYSLMTGYEEAPADVEVLPGQYYNPYFPGGVLSMAPPLMNDLITYNDGTNASTEQMARDLVNFLQWTAEPEMEQRKRMGIKVLVFLAIMTVMFYFAKKRIWSDITPPKEGKK